MAIILGGITLPRNTIWEDRESDPRILQERDFTLGGKQIVSTYTLPTGMPITLRGVQDAGWITLLDYNALRALADVAGAIYTLDYMGTLYSVIFRHDDPPAIDGKPLIYRNAQQDTDYYTYTIKLVTV